MGAVDVGGRRQRRHLGGWRRAVIVVGCALVGAVPAAAHQDVERPDVDALAHEAFDLLNQYRLENGVAALRFDPSLALIAQHHSQELASRSQVSHHSTEFGLSTERRVRISFPNLPRIAENVARNRTVEGAHAGLIGSSGHRRNRLDELFTDVGVGVAWDGNFGLYFTEVFARSADGQPLGQPLAYYFDAAPGAYERRDEPRVERGPTMFQFGAPGDDDPEFWTHRGINAYAAGELADAEEAFRKALALQADYHYAQYNLARVLISREANEEAAELLDELLERDPGDVDSIATRGTAALFLQQYAEAAEYFRRVLRARSEDPGAWYNLGLALEYDNRYADAAIAYREALKFNPGLAAAQAGLVRVRRH